MLVFMGCWTLVFSLSFFLERGCIFSFVGGGGDGGLTLFQYVWTFNLFRECLCKKKFSKMKNSVLHVPCTHNHGWNMIANTALNPNQSVNQSINHKSIISFDCCSLENLYLPSAIGLRWASVAHRSDNFFSISTFPHAVLLWLSLQNLMI